LKSYYLDFLQLIFGRKVVELPFKFWQKLNIMAIAGNVLSDKGFPAPLPKETPQTSQQKLRTSVAELTLICYGAELPQNPPQLS